MDTSVAARIVSERCGIFSIQVQHNIFLRINGICGELHVSPEAAVEMMIQRWEQYKEARPKLTWKFSNPANFLFSVDWNDPAAWPWIRATPKPQAPAPNAYLIEYERRKRAIAEERSGS